MVQQQYEAHRKYEYEQRSMRWTVNEYNRDALTQSLRLTAARLRLAVGQRAFGPREQRDQRTQRASFVATYHARVHTEQQLIVLGSDAWFKKIPREAPRHVSSRPD